jgi:EAL domain-containing protein (putative c-di-GMP-specific phosphodiesterase class I)/ActR/RegA family two-component response regulator
MSSSFVMATEAQESQLVLVVDDDPMITDGLAAGLEREGRTLITCNDIESAEMMVERFHPSHVVADIRLSGPFSFEGLDFVRYVGRHAPSTRVILMSGDTPEALQLEGSERGAVAFLKKPFEVHELDNILNLISCSPLSMSSDEQRLIRVPLIDEIIRSSDLRPFFQPIVTLDAADTLIGYESLARYRADSPLRNPDMLFTYAGKKNRVADLEFACISGALAAANSVSRSGLIFLNVHPAMFAIGRELADTLERYAILGDVSLERIVLEITEQGELPDSRTLFETFDYLRDIGVRFALDDVGVAYSHLPLIGKIRPSFLKISQHFGTGFERDPAKTKLVSNIVSLAQDFGCDVILEGIEERSTAKAAAALGIALGQGYLFGRPADPVDIGVEH